MEIQVTIEDLIALKEYYKIRQLNVGGYYYKNRIKLIEEKLDKIYLEKIAIK